MHTTLIRRIAVDTPRNRLITCSDDKTVRVWQMPEARLIRTLRVPIDKGHEGQLFAVAVSPDGKTVATGGWTGWDWDGAASLYLFDIASGELIHRVGGFKDAFQALTWTRDGKHLLIGLQARGGLHRLRLSDYQVVASDLDYRDKIMEIDERLDGLVVTVALDGMVRLYDRDFKLLGRRTVAGGSKPSSVRFSPDGRWLAVSFFDQPAITLLQARDLSEAYRPRIEGVDAQAGFNSVGWSSDGRYLYAGGDYRGSGETPLYRWADGGRGALQSIPVSNNRIIDVQPMAEGAMAFAAEDPGVGIVGPDGKRHAWRGPEIVDFSASQGRIELSADGSLLRYPTRRTETAMRSFSPLLAGDQGLEETSQEKSFRPLTHAPGMEVARWKDSFDPTINGKQALLDEYEMSRSYALHPKRKVVLLGTEWALRLFDANAEEIWSVKLPAVAWAVNIAQNGKLAVAALSDGTLRWYRMSDGHEELAYFPHSNGRDWVAWVPNGYYMSSVYGDNFVGWHFNRGRDLTPDFYRAVQFDRILYRPDVVAAAFLAAIKPTTTRSLGQNTPAANFEIGQLRDIAPPRLSLQPLATKRGRDGEPRLQLQIKGERNRLDMQDLTVFVNNIPVTPSQQRRLSGRETERFERQLEVELFDRGNNIRVESFTGVSMGVAETYYELSDPIGDKAPAGDLYLLAVGINAFPKLPPRAQLAYGAADAAGIAEALRQRGSSYFRRVNTQLLTDDTNTKPDRRAILDALDFLSQTRPKDTVVVFLASHGISDPAGNYYFVPRDAEPADLEALREGRTLESLLPWTVFFEALRGAAGRRLLIVDTCQARNIEGRFEPYSLMKRSAASLFSLIVASKGDEESQEYAPGKHGLFTYALIDALSPSSDTDNNGLVTVQEVFTAARPIVERLRDKSVGPQTPQLIAPPPLGELPLARTTGR
ncbi:caspase family protein [Thauera sp. 2A1]|uniref:caspase family protein n=1 Tax=Thauera sp. 2A1 TaxID=2570191 RepID=UPI001885598B|nr:caspase family protein [Thauera sp. 2A1]KAI5916449.1 caspase family protein [Thauera sp. 2A1]